MSAEQIVGVLLAVVPVAALLAYGFWQDADATWFAVKAMGAIIGVSVAVTFGIALLSGGVSF